MSLLRLTLGVLLVAAMSRTASGQLTHRYSFNDGTANDSVGTANGVLSGATWVAGGQVVLPGTSGDYVDLPAADIGINTYSRLTFELWSSQSASLPGS
jgi:hypothetical protein